MFMYFAYFLEAIGMGEEGHPEAYGYILFTKARGSGWRNPYEE